MRGVCGVSYRFGGAVKEAGVMLSGVDALVLALVGAGAALAAGSLFRGRDKGGCAGCSGGCRGRCQKIKNKNRREME